MLSQFFKSKPLTDVLENRRLHLLLEQTHASGYMAVSAACGLAFYMFDDENGDAMLLWVVVQVVHTIFRGIVESRIKTALNQGKKRYHLFHGIYSFFIFLSGTCWGVGAYLFLPDPGSGTIYIGFITFIFAVTTAGLPSLVSSLKCYFVFLVPISIGLSVRLYEQHSSIIITVIIYSIFLAILSGKLNRVIMHSLVLDIENEKLVASVTVEKRIAEQANIEKSQFLAAASHDLRQPLNSMGLFLFALRARLKSIEDQKPLSILGQVDNSYLALKELFDSLMEISRLDAGTLQTENKNIQLDFILRPLTDEMSEQAFEKGLEFNYQPSDCSINTDPILLSRIIRNLIGNAIKYTQEGKIDVIETIDGDFVTIKIVDTGIGIPKTEFQNIFSEYHQLANKRRDRRQGIGLGLSLVKKMSELLNAEISVDSIVNKGSTFTIRLPLADKVEKTVETTSDEIQSLKGIKVLVIDDEPDILLGMELLLTDWQCQVELAETYQQALVLATETIPDIILCDYRLQDNMTGIEAIEMLHQEINQYVPALIISGDTDPALLKSIQANGYNMLSKPIQPLVLQTEIGLISNNMG